MDTEWMSAALRASDHTMKQPGHRSDARAQAPDSDAITVAAGAGACVQDHHERASRVMRQLRTNDTPMTRRDCSFAFVIARAMSNATIQRSESCGAPSLPAFARGDIGCPLQEQHATGRMSVSSGNPAVSAALAEA